MLFASMAATQVPATSAALQLCRPAIARKAEGQIAVISVTRSYASRRTRLVRGQVTVFVGMGPAAPALTTSSAQPTTTVVPFVPDASGM